jgi:hypothetical protein
MKGDNDLQRKQNGSPRSFMLYRVAVAVSVLCIALALIGLIAFLLDKNAMTVSHATVWGCVLTNNLGSWFLHISRALLALSALLSAIAPLALRGGRLPRGKKRTGATICFVIGMLGSTIFLPFCFGLFAGICT